MALQQMVSKVFGSRFQREVKQLRPLVAQVHEHEQRLKGLSDAEVQAQTALFRARIRERAGFHITHPRLS